MSLKQCEGKEASFGLGKEQKHIGTNVCWTKKWSHTLLFFLHKWTNTKTKGDKFLAAANHISQTYSAVVTPYNVANHVQMWKIHWIIISRLKNTSGSGSEDGRVGPRGCQCTHGGIFPPFTFLE